MSEKKPIKRKKKVATIFAKNPEVLSLNKKRNKILKQISQSEAEMEHLFESYHDNMVKAETAEDFFERLPLDTIKDLHDFEAGTKKDFSMEILREKSRIENDRGLKIDEIIALNKTLKESQIDLLLAKINCVIESLN